MMAKAGSGGGGRRLRVTEQPPPPPGGSETKAEKWRRIAEGRVRTAGLALNNVRKLANRETYDYSPEDAAKIIAFLRGKVDSIEQSFQSGVELDEFTF